jgi:hypothetical protein
VLLEIVRPDALFGEFAFLDTPPRFEWTTAVEETTLMTWAISDVGGFTRWIESFAIDSIEQRLGRICGRPVRFPSL